MSVAEEECNGGRKEKAEKFRALQWREEYGGCALEQDKKGISSGRVGGQSQTGGWEKLQEGKRGLESVVKGVLGIALED